MTIYNNIRPDTQIRSLEVSNSGEAQLSFLHLAPNADVKAIQELLRGDSLQQEILATTPMGDHTLIVARGNKSPQMLLSALSEHGEHLVPAEEPKKKISAWQLRGYASIVGQVLQFTSGIRNSHNKGDSAAVIGFAVSNMLANLSNIFFGAQKKADPHRLELLKREVNEQFASVAEPGTVFADPKATLVHKDAEEYEKLSNLQKFKNFAQRHSVSIGEIGLRVLGSISLVFPVTKLGGAFKILREQKSASAALEHALNENKATRLGGIFYLVGKAISFSSTEPDPYNPKPRNFLDTIREKYTFPISSLIEGTGTGIMAHNRLTRKDASGKPAPDVIGGTGNLVFIGGFAVRLTAPFGTREVNMRELKAHITNGLAKLPEDKIPQALADTVMKLHDHFTDKPLEVSTLYTEIARDLERFHHITLKAPQVEKNHQTKHEQPPLTIDHAAHHGRLQAAQPELSAHIA